MTTAAAAAKAKFGTTEAEFNAVAELLGTDADDDDFCPTCLEVYTDGEHPSAQQHGSTQRAWVDAAAAARARAVYSNKRVLRALVRAAQGDQQQARRGLAAWWPEPASWQGWIAPPEAEVTAVCCHPAVLLADNPKIFTRCGHSFHMQVC